MARIFADGDFVPTGQSDNSAAFQFMGGIARQNKMKAIEVGGVEDHVHLLLSLPSAMPVSKAMQWIKGGSSKWIHETFPEQRLFTWQEEYGAFRAV